MKFFKVIRAHISTVLQVAALIAIVQAVVLTTPSVDTGPRPLVINFEDAVRSDLLYYAVPAALV